MSSLGKLIKKYGSLEKIPVSMIDESLKSKLELEGYAIFRGEIVPVSILSDENHQKHFQGLL